MKKLLAAILGSVLLLAGCSSAPSPEVDAVTKTAETFLKDFHNGDVDGLLEVSTDHLSEALDANHIMESAIPEEILESMTKESKDSFRESFGKIYALGLEEYSLGKVTVDGDEATANVTVKGVPFDDIEGSLTADFSEQVSSDLVEQMLEDNPSVIDDYLEDHTQNETMSWLFSQIFPEVGRQCFAEVDKNERSESKWQLKLIKEDDKWVVDDFNYS